MLCHFRICRTGMQNGDQGNWIRVSMGIDTGSEGEVQDWEGAVARSSSEGPRSTRAVEDRSGRVLSSSGRCPSSSVALAQVTGMINSHEKVNGFRLIMEAVLLSAG